MKKIVFSEEHCVMCGVEIPEGRQVCIKCEQKVLEEKRVEEKEKKEGFFKRLYKDKKMQRNFFICSMVLIFVIYIPAQIYLNDNVIKRRIDNKSIEFDVTILGQMEQVNLEKGKVNLSGWVLKTDTEVLDVKVVLLSENKELQILKTEKKQSNELEDYMKYLEIESIEGRGFTTSITEKKLQKDVCYEVILYVSYKEESKERTKKIATSQYLYNGEIYKYNPKEFMKPVFTDELMNDVVENGIFCGYNKENGVWVYSYEENLYWILDKQINKSENIRIFFHLNTPCVEKLPEIRKQYGFDNKDFNLSDNKFIIDSNSNYWVAVSSLKVEYPISYISTGQYNTESLKNLWDFKFKVLLRNNFREKLQYE